MERNLTLITVFAALIVVLGLVPAIPLGFGVPITLQSLGVMLAGAVLGSWRGALAVLLVQGLVALGLPVLAGGRGGLGIFVGPTAGFLIGWLPAAFVTGFIVERIRALPVALAAGIGSVLGGIGVLYALGIVGFWLFKNAGMGPEDTPMSLWTATLIMAPFIPGDLVKAVLAGMIARTIARYRPSALIARA
ncbi:biotin transport system substrate-specific component [Rhodobacter sp. JA431]|uniref:biotin transporter BioY n=1 Tax=Rhodobacter sp. JA431 TaxID=570013 RepID=UPI000BC748BD|nr:biotin transporter BioY [Rhodobacter sp. JA431]SOC16108.1 biotin transport system substrate-specific component [Rhodobacter sp. JA431]